MNGEQDISDRLPELERQVFSVVRGLGSASVADVVAALQADQRALAYTTVMTVLNRLWQKGYLVRQREGRAHRYDALSSQDFGEAQSAKLVRELLDRYGNVALAGFVQTLTLEQRQLLTRLLGDELGRDPSEAIE